MSYLKQFTLPVKGFGLGRSSFEYKIGNQFFEHFEDSEVSEASIAVMLDVNKQSNMMVLNFNMHGTVQTQCDRCLDDFDFIIESKQTLFVKYGNEETDLNDDVIFISEGEHEINVAQFIFEFINLSLPIKKVHGIDKKGKSLCNKEMLNKISDHSVEEEEQSDPRWDKLKDLM